METAVELCLERALVLRDLAALPASILDQLLAEAATATIVRSLPPAKSRYLQLLLSARTHTPVWAFDVKRGVEQIADVPLRLFPRVLDVANLERQGDRELEQSLGLEIAAASEGRTMSEWAALRALRLVD
jgi:hypothetical protein